MSLKYQSEAFHSFSATVSATTPAAIIPAFSGNKILRVYRIILTLAGTAGTVQLQDTGNNNLSQPFQLAIDGVLFLDAPLNNDPWWVATAPGLGLQAVITGGGTLGWDVWWLNT